MTARALSYLWYPLFFAIAIVVFGAMLATGNSPVAAAYVPIALVAVAVVALEGWFPERSDWRPRWSDVKADAAFLAIVQVAVPRVLAAFCVLAIAGWMHWNAASALWPQDWPLAAQIVAMVLIVDFVRYWLHRAFHRFDTLWRFHEVHHSPEILYTLNVGRFHPCEKVLHFGADTLPFLMLGVAPEVIAGYFLVYSVNGFFQHSNVRLRHGWLNYVVASAETHRWHHARDPKTAACNFSNTTIVWDWLFGTWHLPRDRTVADIGIMNRAYPRGFLDQMRAPFVQRGGDPKRRGFKLRLANLLVPLQLRLVRLTQGRRLVASARNPMRIQYDLLASILRRNRSTVFGRQHDFATITGYRDFIERVPVGDYEALRPFIEAEIEHGEPALTAAAPVRYVRTSGTTGSPKNLPLTGSHLESLRRIHRISIAFQHRACPEAFAGSILAIVSPAFEGTLPNGKPFGSASGIVAGDTPALVLEKFVVPRAVLTVTDSRLKYLLILRLALNRRDISYMGAANSTTLLAIMKLYRAHATALIDDVRNGTFFLANEVPPEVWSVIRPRLRPDAERATELAGMEFGGAAPRIADLWPALRLIVTWTCSSAGVTLDALRRELSPRTRILELGYLSSEFRGTITLGRRADFGLPTFDTHFFEFVEREDWDAGRPRFLTLDRIRKGVDYYIIATTPSGLFRYFINDLVRVTGRLHGTPLLRFLQKGKGVTNITGEKLYEAQVLEAVRSAMSEFGQAARFVMMQADEVAQRYHLYVEPNPGVRPEAVEFGRCVDAKLCAQNIEYQAKRESDRLGPPVARWLAPDTGEAYKQFCIAKGQREGQFKAIALAYRTSADFRFDDFTESA